MERYRPRSNDIFDHKLKLHRKLAYSIGHIYNDLISACFFSYITIYVNIAIRLDTYYAGYMIFASQLIDTILNPFVGFIQDKCKSSRIFGKRIVWYFIGVISSTVSFWILFNEVFGDSTDSQIKKLWNCIPAAALTGIGYVFIQISHLSILTEISSSELDRIQLNGWRNAWTLMANIVVYCGVWILLSIHTGDDSADELTSRDVHVFNLMSRIIIGLGIVSSLVFGVFVRHNPLACNLEYSTKQEQHCDTQRNVLHLDTKFRMDDNLEENNMGNEEDMEKHIQTEQALNKTQLIEHSDDAEMEDIGGSNGTTENKAKHWIWSTLFKNFVFYEVTIIYSCTRFSVLISQIYIPLYVTETLQMDKTAIGILPLIFYVSGFGASLLMKKINERLSIKKIFVVGEVSTLGACLWIFFIAPSSHQQVYGASVILGIGQATLNVTAVAMVTTFIGDNASKSGTVFGIIGFVEKMMKTIFLLMLQLLNECSDFYKIMMIAVPSAATVIASVFMTLRHFRDRRIEGSIQDKQHRALGEE